MRETDESNLYMVDFESTFACDDGIQGTMTFVAELVVEVRLASAWLLVPASSFHQQL